MNTKALKIGIPARFFYPGPERDPILGPKTYTAVEQDTLDHFARAGAIPVMLPPLEDVMLSELLDEMDGLALQGGSDMAPASYGEAPIQAGRWAGDPQRDAFELNLIRMAMQREMPILGICRGFQVLNVYFGGSLYQDLPTQFGEVQPHRDIPLYDRFVHPIAFEPGGLLAELYGDEGDKMVNSIHHQGVKALGDGLRVEAVSPVDGLVEAFVWEGAAPGKVMGVQWHPEFFHHAPEGLVSAERLLGHWLGHCAGYRRARRSGLA